MSKLCKEADGEMSEATKLKTLLNKTKPSIHLEIQKKKPTSTREVLAYAKEAEELSQLSNIDTNHSIFSNHNTTLRLSISLHMITSLLPMYVFWKIGQ